MIPIMNLLPPVPHESRGNPFQSQQARAFVPSILRRPPRPDPAFHRIRSDSTFSFYREGITETMTPSGEKAERFVHRPAGKLSFEILPCRKMGRESPKRRSLAKRKGASIRWTPLETIEQALPFCLMGGNLPPTQQRKGCGVSPSTAGGNGVTKRYPMPQRTAITHFQNPAFSFGGRVRHSGVTLPEVLKPAQKCTGFPASCPAG